MSRLLSVPAKLTFDELHHAIQVAFGWAESHLYSFTYQKYGENERPAPGGQLMIHGNDPQDDVVDSKFENSHTLKMCDMFEDLERLDRSTFIYEYDFGDGWEHIVELVGRGLSPSIFPWCQAGEGHPVAEYAGGKDLMIAQDL